MSAGLRNAGALAITAGAGLAVAGAAAWCAVTTQLSDEKITVPSNATFLPGKAVRGPVTAFAQALAIKVHAERAAGGRTYADVSAAMRTAEAGSEEERTLRSQSLSLSTAAALRTSLMTSVLAYGVSALVTGLGGLFVLLGSQLRRTR